MCLSTILSAIAAATAEARGATVEGPIPRRPQKEEIDEWVKSGGAAEPDSQNPARGKK